MVQRSEIWMMLVPSQVPDIKAKQADYTNTSSKAQLKYDEEVYIKITHGFDIK